LVRSAPDNGIDRCAGAAEANELIATDDRGVDRRADAAAVAVADDLATSAQDRCLERNPDSGSTEEPAAVADYLNSAHDRGADRRSGTAFLGDVLDPAA
jgi:hypothetical protein